MKTLHWNHSQILSEFPECENLSELIAAIEKKCQVQSMYVCLIRVNGMTLEAEDENRFAEADIKEIQEIEVEFGSVSEIISGILLNFSQWLPYLQELVEDVADSLRLGQMDFAKRSLNELADAVTDVVASLGELKKTKAAMAGLSGLSGIEKLEGLFLSTLKALLSAFERSDFVLAADILEYDLSQVLNELKAWVELNRQNTTNQEIHLRSPQGNGEATT